MKITAMRRSTREGREPTDALAILDLQLTPDCLIKSVMLKSRGDGRYWIVPPRAFGSAAYTFSPHLARTLTTLAVAEYEEKFGATKANDDAAAS